MREKEKELSQIECALMHLLAEKGNFLSPLDEDALRWALSLARISTVLQKEGKKVKAINIGHATDAYRRELYKILNPEDAPPHKIDPLFIPIKMGAIRTLCAKERKDLGLLFGDRFSLDSLDAAVRSRPLALTLGGGGGCSYIFTGALALLEEIGIKPAAISGTSMGAILGAFRARQKDFDLEEAKYLASLLSWRNIAEPLAAKSRFGVPATFHLRLREILGPTFEKSGKALRIKDLSIPLRVAVTGLSYLENHKEPDLSQYEHLLDDIKGHIFRLRNKGLAISQSLLQLAKQPLRPLYIGSDPLSQEFDVIDAIGFSAAVPGIFHYDIDPTNTRMTQLATQLLEENNVFRLIDGGYTDNLPVTPVLDAIEKESRQGRDPFVLALDGFAPNLTRHWLFLPLMRMASENTKDGREKAHLTITYKKVLSPLSVVPTQEALSHAISNGIAETKPHIPFIQKMLGPIPDPIGIVKNPP